MRFNLFNFNLLRVDNGDYPLDHYARQAAAQTIAETFDYQLVEPSFTHRDFVAIIDNYFWFIFFMQVYMPPTPAYETY